MTDIIDIWDTENFKLPTRELKLWVDDIRRPPGPDWYWARTNAEARDFLTWAQFAGVAVPEASLDHDMGLHNEDPDEEGADFRVAPDHWQHEDGMDLVKWMCEEAMVPPVITVHSMNEWGAKNMATYLRNAAKHMNFPCDVTVKQYGS